MNRKLIFGITLFFSLLTILFFYNEKLETSQKINDEKFANFFTIIGSIATASSIFLLYRQIREMQEDRKASNKPDLYPETTYYKILRLKSFHDQKLLEILLERTDQLTNNSHENHINVFNIGLGSAKEIEFEWIFDKSKIEDMIKGVYYYNDNQLLKNQYLNFISANDITKIEPPYFFLKCCGIDFNKRETPIKELIDVNISDKPPLKLKINYRDIYNYPINKVFDVIIHANYDNVTLMFREEKSPLPKDDLRNLRKWN